MRVSLCPGKVIYRKRFYVKAKPGSVKILAKAKPRHYIVTSTHL